MKHDTAKIKKSKAANFFHIAYLMGKLELPSG